jgi:hypothetical protein
MYPILPSHVCGNFRPLLLGKTYRISSRWLTARRSSPISQSPSRQPFRGSAQFKMHTAFGRYWRAGVTRIQDQVPLRLARTGTMFSPSWEEVYITSLIWRHDGFCLAHGANRIAGRRLTATPPGESRTRSDRSPNLVPCDLQSRDQRLSPNHQHRRHNYIIVLARRDLELLMPHSLENPILPITTVSNEFLELIPWNWSFINNQRFC